MTSRDKQLWHRSRRVVLRENLGYKVELFNSCLCCAEATRGGIFRYGHVALGSRSQTAKFGDELGKELIVKCRGVLGPRSP